MTAIMRPVPLDMPHGAGVDVAAVVAEWFGKGGVLLGTLTPRGHLVHRGEPVKGFAAVLPACGQVCHGQAMTIVRGLAVVQDTTMGAAVRALEELEERPSRLCRRCWRSRYHQNHAGRVCWLEERGTGR